MHEDIYSLKGECLGGITLSERQIELLEADVSITVQFHTPQLLRNRLGERNGSFALRKIGDRIVAYDHEQVRRYIGLQNEIANAQAG